MKPIIGCLGLILIVLIVGAAFGFAEWHTVGKFVRTLAYMVLYGIGFLILLGVWGWFTNKN